MKRPYFHPVMTSGRKGLLTPCFLGVFLFFATNTLGQQVSVGLGTRFPLDHSGSLEYTFAKGIGVSFRGGVLAPPYDTPVLTLMETYGMDPGLTPVLKKSAQKATVLQIGGSYRIQKHIIGLHGQWVGFREGQVPVGALEDNWGVSVPETAQAFGQTITIQPEISLQTVLYQTGLWYEYRIPLRDERWEIRCGAGISFNIASRSELSVTPVDVEEISTLVEKEVENTYQQYAHVPFLSLGLARTFKL